MFPLSCAHVCAHTGRKTCAHKTWSTQKITFPKMCLYTLVNGKKHSWKTLFCALHVFLLLLMYQSRNFTRSRSLQTFTKWHFVSILNCLNVFDITILLSSQNRM